MELLPWTCGVGMVYCPREAMLPAFFAILLRAICYGHQLTIMDLFCAPGTPWTEEEHRMFLMGLQRLGKGDWRGISRSFVVSRTPTQVASHAQKYFIRQTNSSRRKRRSSLLDRKSVV